MSRIVIAKYPQQYISSQFVQIIGGFNNSAS